MEIRQDVDLTPYNSFGISARAHHFVSIGQPDELAAVFRHARQEKLRVLVLGSGSNILFVNDFLGLVLHMATRGVDLDESTGRVRVAAGEVWHDFVATCMNKGFHGLENLALIPGTVGAAPVQNIGAYGVELGDLLVSVTVFDSAELRFRTLEREACEFDYRHSLFKQPAGADLVITEVELQLSRDWQPETSYRALSEALQQAGISEPTPQQLFDTVCQVRLSKLPDPARLGNAGSFFKNPVVSSQKYQALLADFPAMPSFPTDEPGLVKIPAAWLLDELGCKGQGRGGAAVHEQHALVLVNRNRASGEDIFMLAQDMSSKVLTRFGIALQPEVRII
jgi:UDP-N-acetylmuramate dehydrogenase